MCVCVCVCVCCTQSCLTLCYPVNCSRSASFVHGFSRQGNWSGVPPTPGNLPNPGFKLRSPGLQADSLPSKPPGKSFSSVALSCPTLCNPMNHSTPGLPVHHKLPRFTQIQVHRVSDAIQPSHPLLSFCPAPNPSQHQSLFQ